MAPMADDVDRPFAKKRQFKKTRHQTIAIGVVTPGSFICVKCVGQLILASL